MDRRTDEDLIQTLFAQANGAIDPQTGGLVPPIQPATTFARDAQNIPMSETHIYARDDNSLVRLAETILAKAERAQAGLLFPSGMAAVAAILRTVPNKGRIIMQSGIYWGVTKFARELCKRRKIDLIEVDTSKSSALRKVAKKADLVWIETPSNPYLRTSDIAACAQLAHENGAELVVDSTAATPCLTKPLDLGADFVVHSATKAINGHSDVLAGFLATRRVNDDRWQAVVTDRHDAGAVIGSFEAWLLIRGMRTLPLRMERMCANALAVAQYLDGHKAVERVLYPGLPDDPGHTVACRQMDSGFGSLLSFQLAGGKSAALHTVSLMRLFKRATSLGGVESLVEHRHTIEDTVPDNLLRLSVGIEAEADLIADLERSLVGSA